jgi:autotransporter-associated beta strand protein
MRRYKRTRVLTRAALGFGLGSGGMLALAAQVRANLVIDPTFDSTIISDPNAATIEAAINSAISRVEADISNNVTVDIYYKEMTSGLGESESTEYYDSYSGYRSLLAGDQTLSADDTVALAHLPIESANPVDGNSTSESMVIAAPTLRALGQNAPGVLTSSGESGGSFDGIVGLNTSICNLSRTGTQNPSFYDLQAVAAHETDEVLGIGGTGSTLYLDGAYTGQSAGTGSIGVLDLYRYASNGVRSYTLNPNVNAYFSIDGGATNFVYFDQNDEGADFADWGNGTPNAEAGNIPPQVQDSFGTPGVDTNIGANELAALDVVGWNLTSAGLAIESLIPASLTWNDASSNNLWDNATSSNWNNGTANTTFTAQSNVTFNDSNGGASGRYSVTLNTTVSPGSVTVNNTTGNYTISGTGTIGGTGSLTKSGTGTLTLSTANTFTDGTIVSAGRLLIEPTSATTCALPTGALSISGGTVQLANNVSAGTALDTSNVVLTSLSMTGTGTLDIGNNRVIIDYSSPATDPIASIATWIKNGFYSLSGPQIVSSDIAADDTASGLSYGIGYADGADHTVAGLPSGEIEIMFTLLGDANLDGTVNAEDFTPFSQHLGESGMWDGGDFNYDGTVNAEDFTPFSHNLGQPATLAAAAGVLESADDISPANVPEPASVGIMMIAGLGILRRWRRS